MNAREALDIIEKTIPELTYAFGAQQALDVIATALAERDALWQALTEIASGPCCESPGCCPDDPMCEPMMARAAIANVTGES